MASNDKRIKCWCGTGKVGVATATTTIQHSPPMDITEEESIHEQKLTAKSITAFLWPSFLQYTCTLDITSGAGGEGAVTFVAPSLDDVARAESFLSEGFSSFLSCFEFLYK